MNAGRPCRRPPILPSIALCLLVAACATSSTVRFGWSFFQGGEDARLIFGQPESDNISLSFDCRRGSGVIAVTTFGGEGERYGERRATRLSLSVGQARESLHAVSESGDTGWTTDAVVGSPMALLREMARGQRLRVRDFESDGTYPPPRRGLVSAFATACGVWLGTQTLKAEIARSGVVPS